MIKDIPCGMWSCGCLQLLLSGICACGLLQLSPPLHKAQQVSSHLKASCFGMQCSHLLNVNKLYTQRCTRCQL